MRQAVVQHEKVWISDTTRERKKKSTAEKEAEKGAEEEVVRIRSIPNQE
jgi:hypothetical protein